MNIIHLDKIESTNEYAKKNIEELKDKTAIYADSQTSGHGRLGRKWIDTGSDNLYLSIVLKPFNDLNPIYPNLTQYLSVILTMLIEEEYGLSPEIKWPNDVLINGKKVAGILSEGATKGGIFQGLILGVGVNLNTPIELLNTIDKPATSVYAETGKKIDKKDFLTKLLSKFFLLYDKFIEEGFLSVKDYYIKKATFLEKTITIDVIGKMHTGIAKGITDNGSLILQEGTKEEIYYIGDIL